MKSTRTAATVLILSERPTQFEAPMYRWLSAHTELALTVWFYGAEGLAFDPELGHRVDWGLDLFSGYSSRLLGSSLALGKLKILLELSAAVTSRRIALIVVPGWSTWWAAYTVGLARCIRRPLAVNVDSSPLHPQGGHLRRLFRRLAFLALTSPTTVFLTKGSLSSSYVKSKSPRSMITLYPYTIDTEWWRSNSQDQRAFRQKHRAMLGIAPSDHVLLAVLKFIEREGVTDLLKAFRGARAVEGRITLVLIGSGPLCHKVEEEVPRHRGSLVCPGYVKYRDLPQYYALADAFVHPGREEPWGVSVAEAASCGLPIIVSSGVGSGADLVKEGRSGFHFRAGSAAHLQACILRMAGLDASARSKMGEEAFGSVSKWSFWRNYEGLCAALRVTRGR